MGFLTNDLRSNDRTIKRRMKADFLGFYLLKELIKGIELTGNAKRLENGMVSGGVVGESRLLRSPVEETKSKGMVVDKARIDDSGDECRTERFPTSEAVQRLLQC